MGPTSPAGAVRTRDGPRSLIPDGSARGRSATYWPLEMTTTRVASKSPSEASAILGHDRPTAVGLLVLQPEFVMFG